MLGVLTSCQVQLVLAPYTPTGVELSYSGDEDLTRLRWNVSDSTSVTFERARANSWETVDFSAAPYASGEYGCGARRCFQLVFRGKLTLPPGGVLLRANHSSLGLFPGQPATQDSPPSTVKVQFSLDDGNAQVEGELDDWLSIGPLQRRFGYEFYAGPDCSAPPDSDLPTTLSPGPQQLAFSLATDEGHYCGRVRPVALDNGPRASFTAPFDSVPEVFRQQLDYRPPSETAPIVWRFISDLQIADAARCNQVATTLHDLFAAAFAAAGAGHELARVDLSPGCVQDPGRSLDGAMLADDVKSWLAANSGNQFQAPILVYVNNLDAPLPQSLVDSLTVYLDSFPDPTTVPLDVALATGAAVSSFPWSLALQFAAIEDPQLAQSIKASVMAGLPLETELHNDDDLIPLMTPDTVAAEAGHPWKLCQASPAIQRRDGAIAIDDSELTPLIDPANPPSFTVMLPQQILVPATSFAPDEVLARWEICRRWCDHAFRDESGTQRSDWLTTPVCVKSSVP